MIYFCLIDSCAFCLSNKLLTQSSRMSCSSRSLCLKNTMSHFKQKTLSCPWRPLVSLTCCFMLWIRPRVAPHEGAGHLRRPPLYILKSPLSLSCGISLSNCWCTWMLEFELSLISSSCNKSAPFTSSKFLKWGSSYNFSFDKIGTSASTLAKWEFREKRLDLLKLGSSIEDWLTADIFFSEAVLFILMGVLRT